MQTTLAQSVTFTGVGLHSGRPVRLTLQPAPVDHGIVFRRADVTGRDQRVPAVWDRVIVSPLNTRVENDAGVQVSTIEHVMAALAGTGVSNALCVIDGPEVPIMDGSSAPFVRGLMKAGLVQQNAPLMVIEVLKSVSLDPLAEATARFDPAPELTIDFTIDFEDAAIGHQQRVLNMANGAFLRTICDSRTFCRRQDVEAMQAKGFALGGTYDNAVVVDGCDVLSPGGLRHADEAVRHKMLDALGDLYTAGAPIVGRYTGLRAGHAVTNKLLRKLLTTDGAWRLRPADDALLHRLPGAHISVADLRAVA